MSTRTKTPLLPGADYTGLLRPLTGDEYAALRASIERDGVIVPIIEDEHGNVIDGAHRLRIAGELGVEAPRQRLVGLGEDAKRSMARALNAARRQLSQQEKRHLVADELRMDAARSNR